METFESNGFTFTFDREATRKLYSVRQARKADSCDCDTCRNFAAQRDQLYTPATHELFLRLGIDADKEDEIMGWAIGREAQYAVPFDFVGRVVNAREAAVVGPPAEREHVLADGPNYPWGADDAERANVGPLANLTVNVRLPWILAEPPNTGGALFVGLRGCRFALRVPPFVRTLLRRARRT